VRESKNNVKSARSKKVSKGEEFSGTEVVGKWEDTKKGNKKGVIILRYRGSKREASSFVHSKGRKMIKGAGGTVFRLTTTQGGRARTQGEISREKGVTTTASPGATITSFNTTTKKRMSKR